jgi:formylglycine-generating enzyme required for sulfatase activity
MVEVPAGEFIMGLTLEQATTLNERLQWEYLQTYQSVRDFTPLDASIPQMTVYLDSFKIDVLEVTQARYTACIAAGICQPPPVIYIPGENNPISVNQAAAQIYCQWVGKRLPTEAEWEKAARGTDGRIFPWGDQWDEKRVALTLGPVNSHPEDISPYGVLDMAGNSDEWTLSPDQAYPGHPNPALFSSSKWVARGRLNFPTFLWAGAVTAWRQGDDRRAGFRCVEGGEPVPVAEAVVTYQPAVPPPPPTATAVAVSEMVEIPAGPFLRGVEEQTLTTDQARYAYQDAIPQQSVYLDRYYIDRFPVTVAQFAEFLNQLGYYRWACDGWHCAISIDYLKYKDSRYQVSENSANLPFPFATWYGAEAYCGWRGKRLPTEAEWEKAARGTDGRRYPWGNEWNSEAAGDKEDYINSTRYSVGTKPYLASPYGVQDLIGITSTGEWISDWYAEDYFAKVDSTNNAQGPAEGEEKVLRGGGSGEVEITFRIETSPEGGAAFRCAYTPPTH